MSSAQLDRILGAARRGLYFGLQRAIGSRIVDTWRDFTDWTGETPASLDARIEPVLSGLLDHAVTSVELYRDLGIPRDRSESARVRLARFPILTREVVRARFPALVADHLRGGITSPASVSSKRYDWVVVKTGGTTGVPTSVVHDAECRDWGRASRLFSQRQCGFSLGTPYFRLWGSEEELLQQRVRFDKRVLGQLLGEIPINAFRGTAEHLRAHLAVMRSRPEVHHLMAYIDSAVSLAEYVEAAGVPAPQLRTIMACAGNVTDEMRALLSRVFRAEVFDKYGSRECADIACECARHTGLHVYSPSVLVEVVDEHGNPCAPEVTGRLLVTMLRNRAFPMIRYEIGDLGSWASPGPCPCGLPFPRLATLEGRADDRLLAPDGTLLAPMFVRHFVGVSLNRDLIKEWQFEQRGLRQFVFRYVPLVTAPLHDHLEQVARSFRSVLGSDARIELDCVDTIPLSRSGKRRWVLNSYGHSPSGS